MNCESCGAPLEGTFGRDSVRCGHCGRSQAIVTDREQRQLGPQTGRDCPLCDEPLRLIMLGTHKAECCGRCGGLLLSTDLLSELMTTQAPSTNIPTENTQRSKERIKCPGCNQMMELHPYYGPGRAVIDSCYDCSLIWLDRGELVRS